MLAGDPETGVCIMALEAGLDTGPVYSRDVHADRLPRDRGRAAGPAGRARHRAARRRRCPAVPTTTPEPQSGEPTYADKLTVEEFELDWEQSAGRSRPHRARRQPAPGGVDHRPRHAASRSGGRVRCRRASTREPGTVFGHTRVATGDGALELVEVQPEGRRAMDANAWLAGRRVRRSAARDVNDRRRRASTPRASSRSTRWCGSRTARTRTSCCPRCWRRPDLDRPRPRLRHRARVRHRALATPARRPARPGA